MLESSALFEEFRFRSCLAQTQIEQLEEKVQEFRSFVKEAEERLQRIHEEAKIVVQEQAPLLMGNDALLDLFRRK
jgi:predicted ribosome-associated RNA-binding protein Tma20